MNVTIGSVFILYLLTRSSWRQNGKHLGPIHVNFDKIYVFYNKYCVYINKYVFIIVKIKYVNSSRISDICDKVNFTTKLHIFYSNW